MVELAKFAKWFCGKDHGLINFKLSYENEGVYVVSPDVPGLHLLVPRFSSEAKTLLTAAIKRLFKDNRGMDVQIFWRLPNEGKTQRKS